MSDDVKVLAVAEYMEVQVRMYLKEGDLPPVKRGRKTRRGRLMRFECRELRGLFKITSVIYSRYPGYYLVTLRPVVKI